MEEEKKKTKEVEIKTKSPMWVVVLVAILVIALGCEFAYIVQLKNSTQTQEENIKSGEKSNFSAANEDLTNYQGLWYQNEDADYLEIKSIENNKIVFDWFIYRIDKYDNVIATLEEDGVAYFTSKDDLDTHEISGKIILKDNTVTAEVTEKDDTTSLEEGYTITFDKKKESKISDVAEEKIEEVEDKNAVEVVGLDEKYIELTKATKELAEIWQDFTASKVFKYDLDKSENVNNVEIKIIENEEDNEKMQITYNGKKTTIYSYNSEKVFIVDLDKEDNYFDIVICQLEDNGVIEYEIFKNDGKKLNKIYDEPESGENRLYINGNNSFFLIEDIDSHFDKLVTREYYTITNNKIISNKVDLDKIINEEYIISTDYTYFSKNKNKCFSKYKPEKILEKGTKVKLLGYSECDGSEIVKVKLTDGTKGYIWCYYP